MQRGLGSAVQLALAALGESMLVVCVPVRLRFIRMARCRYSRLALIIRAGIDTCTSLRPDTHVGYGIEICKDPFQDPIRPLNPFFPCRCEIFGSYATGLYVPTSDIDLVILDSGCTNIQAGLKGLAAALAKKKVGRAIQVGGCRGRRAGREREDGVVGRQRL